MSAPPGGPSADQTGSETPTQSETTYHPAHEWIDEEEDIDDDGLDADYEPTPWELHEEDTEFFEVDESSNESMPGLLDESDPNSHLLPDLETLPLEAPQGESDDDSTRLNPTQLLQLFGATGLRRILHANGLFHGGGGGGGEDGFVIYGDSIGPRRPRRRPARDIFPKVPSSYGTGLMGSGIFGENAHFADELKQRRKKLATRLMWREMGIGTPGGERITGRAISQDMIPGSMADKVIHYNSRCYSGQFSDDGNFFFSCAQDFKVRMYDTSNPFDWKYYKTVDYPGGQWTITDASLSPDNKYLAYSSIRPEVCLAATDPNDKSEPTVLDFSHTRRGALHGGWNMGIWSLRFSGDGREIVAGTADHCVIVYDIETRQSILRLQNHQDDVNAVCFGDSSSPHILYSGSDDTTLRVWDRRSMGDGREAGVFMGHTEGLTYVDSKGDGRYILSNGKDQSMKLWDLRKMMTTARFDKINPSIYSTGFDYRYMAYSDDDFEAHPHDCSVVTFRGHSVLKTLIRCHFSPPGSSNSRYVYSGSTDGKVYVYNLDATLAGKIDVGQGVNSSKSGGQRGFASASHYRGDNRHSTTCVRDASWHPYAPVIAATSWNGGGMNEGTCSVHSWSADVEEDEGDPPLGMHYTSELKPLDQSMFGHAAQGRSSRGLRSRGVRASSESSDDGHGHPFDMVW